MSAMQLAPGKASFVGDYCTMDPGCNGIVNFSNGHLLRSAQQFINPHLI